MSNTSELVRHTALIGTGATLTMDVWAAILRRTHTVFGLGLYLAAHATAWILTKGNVP